jgi:hypothetical protein
MTYRVVILDLPMKVRLEILTTEGKAMRGSNTKQSIKTSHRRMNWVAVEVRTPMTRSFQREQRAIFWLLLLAILSLTSARLQADTRYVDVNSVTPVSPYTSWATAARFIQNAIDVSSSGDTVLVTNGVYNSGGRTGHPGSSVSNRIAIFKSITVKSLSGPNYTFIVGQGPLGSNAVRCAYVTNGASLIGFTLTNGFTRTNGNAAFDQTGGGIWLGLGATVSNCIVSGCGAVWGAGAIFFGGGTMESCQVVGNTANNSGGGIYLATSNAVFRDGMLSTNQANSGGGAFLDAGILVRSSVINNSAGSSGGGIFDNGNGQILQCRIVSNLARWGGGAASLSNGLVQNCLIVGNTATNSGGAVYLQQRAAASFCTMVSNTANFGGGIYAENISHLRDSICFGNIAPQGNNYFSPTNGLTFTNVCTLPLPTNGVGNLASGPGFANSANGDFHLALGSRCIDVGSAPSPVAVDLDGNLRPLDGNGDAVPIADIGAYEYAFTNSASISVLGVNHAVIPSGSTTFSITTGTDFGEAVVAAGSADHAFFITNSGNLSLIVSSVSVTGPNANDFTLLDYSPLVDPGMRSDLVVRFAPSGYGVRSATISISNSDTTWINYSFVVRGLGIARSAPRFVWIDSPSPSPPFASWQTAAHTIQDAVDIAVAGDTVWVTNGVYSSGGRAMFGVMTNRVAVDRSVILRSVNGPEVTVIQGYQVPVTINGDGAIRCVYLTNGAVLSGFTLTNGATHSSGDFNDPQDYLKDQGGGGVWCESIKALVTNCTITGNSAWTYGGGACSGTLNDCTLAGNSSRCYGGGAYGGTLNYCALTDNSASRNGGGASFVTLNNCELTGNWAVGSGGGAAASVLNNCELTCNSADSGGGAYESTLNNCTLTGNWAETFGGGSYSNTLNNCILYYNTAQSDSNYDANSTLNYCCTTPAPNSGAGNIAVEPQLASTSHLSATSPCRSLGSAAYATGMDIDGDSWTNPPSIGCDEYRAGALTGALSAAIGASWTNVAAGFAVDLKARITGLVLASAWDFGDGTISINRPYVSHSWSAPGDYTVTLRAYNESHPGGVSATVGIRVSKPMVYVSAANLNSVPPYSSWETAARTIQEAVDAVAVGGDVVVSNGIYASGGRAIFGTMTNRVVVDRPMVVRSVNGPRATVIQGYQVSGTTNGDGAIRCVYLTNGAVLNGFTLTNGATRSIWSASRSRERSGGGVWCESTKAIITNCMLVGNSAAACGGGVYDGTLKNCTLMGNSARDGGGSYFGTLNNCNIADNSAVNYGGGACSNTLYNCTLTGNSAWYDGGGGAYASTLHNCILYYNAAITGPNHYICALNYCCTVPAPNSGAGNITAEPKLASTSHLSASSACRGFGSAAYVTGVDIDGESWLNPPSIGCDEYRAGSLTGPLSVAIGASWTNVAAGFAVDLTARISGLVAASTWNFGDGTVSSNRPYASHAWSTPGDYTATLRAYNESHPGGISATVTIRVQTSVVYVSAASTNPKPPYSSWATAARTIQEAVDATTMPGSLVLVTNGVYATGGRTVFGHMTNRVVVDRPMVVRSVNGPEVTVIHGYQVPGTMNGKGAIRCVYLTEGAVLSGFTLTNGATLTDGDSYLEESGGGAWCKSTKAVITNCTLAGNTAMFGGGVYSGTLDNCTLTGNLATVHLGVWWQWRWGLLWHTE